MFYGVVYYVIMLFGDVRADIFNKSLSPSPLLGSPSTLVQVFTTRCWKKFMTNLEKTCDRNFTLLIPIGIFKTTSVMLCFLK